jgi:hypothetical protein
LIPLATFVWKEVNTSQLIGFALLATSPTMALGANVKNVVLPKVFIGNPSI